MFRVIADLGPSNNSVRSQSVFVLLSLLPAPGLTVDGREDWSLFFFAVVHFTIQSDGIVGIFTLFYTITIMVFPLK